MHFVTITEYDHLESKVAVLESENKRLREALKPFADAFEPKTNTDPDEKWQAAFDRNMCTPSMTMGDFRKAHEAMEG